MTVYLSKWEEVKMRADKDIEDGLFKFFNMFAFERTCPHCIKKERMRKEVGGDIAELLFGGHKKHDSKKCFMADGMLDQIIHHRGEYSLSYEVAKKRIETIWDKMMQLIEERKR